MATTAPLAAAALFAATSIYLWHELAATRRKLDETTEVSRLLNVRLEDLARLHGVQTRPSQARQTAQPPTAVAAVTNSTTDSAPDSASADMASQLMSRPRIQVDSPATERMMHNQERAHMRRSYRDLVAQLGLNAEEANRFYDLMLEKQHSGISPSRPGDPDFDANIQRIQEQQHRKEQEIAALIGNAGMDALKEYEQSFGVRMEVDQMRDQLSSAELPMSDAQRTRLIKEALEEQQQFPRPNFVDGMTEEDIQKLEFAWQHEHTDRMLAQAKQVLTADQYQIYADARQSQLEMQEQSYLHPGATIEYRSPGSGGSTSIISFSSVDGEAQPAKPKPATKKP
jgi:hypothetical protein